MNLVGGSEVFASRKRRRSAAAKENKKKELLRSIRLVCTRRTTQTQVQRKQDRFSKERKRCIGPGPLFCQKFGNALRVPKRRKIQSDLLVEVEKEMKKK